jgi:fucose 4-O-acetylase-like acetyltransferase
VTTPLRMLPAGTRPTLPTEPTGPTSPLGGTGGRDLVLDLLRTGSLLVVVLWHWIFTSVRWADDGPHVGNPVAATPGLWLLTWVLQVMPAFFIVGGSLHARDTTAPLAFWRKRVRRLLLPVLPLLGLAALVAFAAAVAGRPDLVRGVLLVVSPMWFLATYLVCIAVAPLARVAHDRWGWRVVAAGVLVASVIDALRIGGGVGGALTGLAAFVVVWATVHQLGFGLAALRAAPRRQQLTVALAGFTALALAAWWGPYPAAMVGLDGAELSNMGPPTVMVVFLAVGQLGLIAWCEPWLARTAQRARALLTVAGEWSMTVYAWHLLAFAAFWALAVRAGFDVSSRIDGDWWRVRPLWLLGPLVLAVPLCLVARRFDRRAA